MVVVIVLGALALLFIGSNWLLFEGNRRGWWSSADMDRVTWKARR